MSAEEIEREVASREDAFDFVATLFGRLDNGQAVATTEANLGMVLSFGTGGIAVGPDYDGPMPNATWLRPSSGEVEEEVRELMFGVDDSAAARWQPLVAALERQGLKVHATVLDSLPFSVEYTEEASHLLRPRSSIEP